MKTMHLFAGIGGGLLADRILGHEPIVAVEWDKYCCEVLRRRVAEGWFPGMQVWDGDVRMFDPSEYSGRVDCIHAGFPCQDISCAGKQAGLAGGTRSGLYSEVIRIAGEVRPQYIFMENVAAILRNEWLGPVLGDLASLGYDARWCCLRASSVGANHQRDRWWLLADSGSLRSKAGISGPIKWEKRETDQSVYSSENVAYPTMRGLQRCNEPIENHPYQSEIRESEFTGECSGDSRYRRPIESYMGRMVDEFSHRVHNPGWWEVEPDIGRVSTGVSNRAALLRGLGNAQVPLQAAVAWTLLGGPISIKTIDDLKAII